ncbi:MAG: hypothetical protein WCS30_07575, partial [Selenomonadaceae bacterium]
YEKYNTRQPSDGMPFGKINAVFLAVSYRQNPARRQHRIPAQVFLPADESTSGHVAVRQGYVLPFHKFLLYELAQVHYTAGFQYHPIRRSIEPLTDEKLRNVLILYL